VTLHDGPTRKPRTVVNIEKAAPWCVGSNLERYKWKARDVHLRDEERRQLQKFSRKLIELEAIHYRVTENRLTHAHSRDAQD
jgi:hypothetical protein